MDGGFVADVLAVSEACRFVDGLPRDRRHMKHSMRSRPIWTNEADGCEPTTPIAYPPISPATSPLSSPAPVLHAVGSSGHGSSPRGQSPLHSSEQGSVLGSGSKAFPLLCTDSLHIVDIGVPAEALLGSPVAPSPGARRDWLAYESHHSYEH